MEKATARLADAVSARAPSRSRRLRCRLARDAALLSDTQGCGCETIDHIPDR